MLRATLAALLATTLAGCGSAGYLGQSMRGHLSLLDRARPVPEVLADPATPAALKARLALAQRIRDFASAELKLPDNASYRRYADLQRNAAVWNVVAAPELSLALQTNCFPVVGCVGYRGYYAPVDAEAEATRLRAQGLEVGVYPVPAYSTLGKLPGSYFADPLLNTFIQYPEGELARLIFHELAHQVAYAAGDTTFNESFATAVERIGGARWLQEHADAAARAEYARFDERRQDFRRLTGATRDTLDAIYRSTATVDEKRARKAAALAQLRAEHERLKRERWAGFTGYDAWFARANNASFGVLAAYAEQVPAFERLFERQGRDFERFFAEVKRLAALPPEARGAEFASL